MYYKTNFNDIDFKIISFKRCVRQISVNIPESVQCLRTLLKPINSFKYANLQTLLSWVPAIYHKYFRNLPYSETPKMMNNNCVLTFFSNNFVLPCFINYINLLTSKDL